MEFTNTSVRSPEGITLYTYVSFTQNLVLQGNRRNFQCQLFTLLVDERVLNLTLLIFGVAFFRKNKQKEDLHELAFSFSFWRTNKKY